MNRIILVLILILFHQKVHGQIFDDAINEFRRQIDLLLEMMDMNRSLGELMPLNNEDFTRSLANVSDCYAYRLNTSDNEPTFMNIFDKQRRFGDVVKFYYQAFPENRISLESIRSLLSSVREIIALCIMMEQRDPNQDAVNDFDTMKFGFTELSDKNEVYMRKMFGLIPGDSPEFWVGKTSSSSSSAPDLKMRSFSDGANPQCIRTASQLPDSFDWRDQNVVTSVKNQRDCGSCWAFATTGSIESAYLIRGNHTQPGLDLSEEELISCGGRNGCNGGSSVIGFDFVKNRGITTERIMPYQARQVECHRTPNPVIRIIDYCVRSRMRYTRSSHVEHLSDQDIRNALRAFGPLYVAVNADRLSRNYRQGIINDRSCSTTVNHAVLLVGYTPDAWIIKNSWGPRWGEDGYFRLARHQNMCGINTEIAYPL